MTWQQLHDLRLPLAVIAALTLTLLFSGALDRLDNAVGDRLLAWQAQSRRPPDDIVLLAIDQKSLEVLNADYGSWPWPRAIYGELIEGLARFQPKALAFDIHLNEADAFNPDSDQVLVESAKAHADWLYFPSMLLDDGRSTPFTKLPSSFGAQAEPLAPADAGAPLLLPLVLDPSNWRGGLANFSQDPDGIGRQAMNWHTVAGWRLPTFAASIAEHTGATLPAQSRIRLHWYGHGAQRINFSELIHDLNQREPTLAPTLAGKIILVGATTTGLHDLRPTPISTQTLGADILITTLANLRSGDWLRDVPSRSALATILVLGLLLGFGRQAGAVSVGIGLLLVSLGVVAGSYALLTVHRYAPVGAALAIAWLAYLMLTAQAQWQAHRERLATVSMFQRFLDPRVVNALVSSDQLSLQAKPVSREISILFSDIRGFTTLSETRSPEAVVTLLNHYFTRQTDIIFEHGGTVDKFMGDAVMAFWNAPVDLPDHALRAVKAAMAMTIELDRFRCELQAKEPSLGDFDIGIGIHTGPAVVGFLGSQTRVEYTAIGDAVNLACRIESTTKGVARVLVSDATRRACGDTAGIVFAHRGEFHVKGREQPVDLYEPLASNSPVSSRQREGEALP